MKNKKPEKGSIEYISKRKKNTILRTILFFGAAFSVLAIGYFSTGTTKNYLTIIAMLGMLPASRSAVEMIISLRVKEVDETLFHKMEELSKNAAFDLQYNLYFTSEKQNYPVDVLFVTNNCIIGYKNDAKYELKDVKKHMETYMKKDGYSPKIINIVKEESKFILAVKNNLNNKPSQEDLRMEYALKLLSL